MAVLAATVAAMGTGLAPRDASACGGFFCDGGIPMPVDQEGEDILFIDHGETIEVHIRIEYEGEPDAFAWVIPVQSQPLSMAVGSEPLFDNIKNATVPSYGLNTTSTCVPVTGTSTAAGEADDGSFDESGGGGPTIVAQELVGAFEITVLTAQTAADVVEWLDLNGYQQDPESEPIMAQYLEEGFLFAAVKLRGGVGIDELHPIVLTFAGDEPCVPLRLTRIAATEDMDVRTYFLGDGRVVPQNYRHVLVNPLKIDWSNSASNYKAVITAAVDAQHADGRAFVTEYAGTSSIVSSAGIHSSLWNADAFRTPEMTAAEAISTLVEQGFLACGYLDYYTYVEGCISTHALLAPLLETYLPAPQGVDEMEYYLEPQAYADQIDPLAWDGAAFADALVERIITPAAHAVELLNGATYLTRMYTTISPWEMTADPIFGPGPAMGDIPATRIATRRLDCDGNAVYVLPDGRQVYVPSGSPWPDIGTEEDFAEIVEEIPLGSSAPIVLADHSAEIDAALAAYNAAVAPQESTDTTGGETSGTSGTSGTGGLDGTGGTIDASSGSGSGDPMADGDSDAGCSCQASGPSEGPAAWFTVLTILGFGTLRPRRLGFPARKA